MQKINLLNKEKLIKNFSYCNNLEDKYLYIIEIGKILPKMPLTMLNKESIIKGCQSLVWISMKVNENGKVKFYGRSDAAIVRGLVAIIFIFYKNLTLEEIINADVNSFLQSLSIKDKLTAFRIQGLQSIIDSIRNKAMLLYSKRMQNKNFLRKFKVMD